MDDEGPGLREFRRPLSYVGVGDPETPSIASLSPPPPSSPWDGEVLVGPWLTNLIGQYRTPTQSASAPTAPPSPAVVALPAAAVGIGDRANPRTNARPFNRLVIVALIAAALGAASPALLHCLRDAYPNEPDKRQALALCLATNPAFVRFFANDRADCYERFTGIAARAATVPAFSVSQGETATRR